MKPYNHAELSAKKYGGIPEDYLPIHQFIDSSKSVIPDVRHRAIFHSSFGCFVVEQMFGVVRTNFEGKKYSPRDIAEDHCLEDLGFIPTLDYWFKNFKIEQWMGGKVSTSSSKFIPLKEEIYFDAVREEYDRIQNEK